MAIENPIPIELKQFSPTQLGIVWDDGHHSLIPVRKLRLACRCANCVDEWTREKLLKEETVPSDIKPIRIESVGRYALRVDWTDGHSSGIYPFDALRSLCECPKCKAHKSH
jgi:ATP-binding protein involved in chromosome partitioning